MTLDDGLVDEMRSAGVLLLEGVIDAATLQAVRDAVEEQRSREALSRVLESGGKHVRAIHGGHREDDRLAQLVAHPRLLDPARQLLDDEVYLYQFKVNLKEAFGGAAWPWHQDFAFRHRQDAMPEPRALSIALFLDDVTPANGPMMFLQGSHREGLIPTRGDRDGQWTDDVSADLTFTLENEQVRELAVKYPTVAPTGCAGSLLLFHPNIVHASVGNISPDPRAMAIVTYNAMSNVPSSPSKRPEFLVSREAVAIGSPGTAQ